MLTSPDGAGAVLVWAVDAFEAARDTRLRAESRLCATLLAAAGELPNAAGRVARTLVALRRGDDAAAGESLLALVYRNAWTEEREHRAVVTSLVRAHATWPWL